MYVFSDSTLEVENEQKGAKGRVFVRESKRTCGATRGLSHTTTTRTRDPWSDEYEGHVDPGGRGKTENENYADWMRHSQ